MTDDNNDGHDEDRYWLESTTQLPILGTLIFLLSIDNPTQREVYHMAVESTKDQLFDPSLCGSEEVLL